MKEKAKVEVKEAPKVPLKKVDEVRPNAMCKNCQGHVNHNKFGQVGGEGKTVNDPHDDVVYADSADYGVVDADNVDAVLAAGDAAALHQVQLLVPPHLRGAGPRPHLLRDELPVGVHRLQAVHDLPGPGGRGQDAVL